jgi:hypothetical protein
LLPGSSIIHKSDLLELSGFNPLIFKTIGVDSLRIIYRPPCTPGFLPQLNILIALEKQFQRHLWEHDSRRVNAGLWAGPGSWQAGARMGRPQLHRKQLWFLLQLILVLLCGLRDAAGAIGCICSSSGSAAASC